jgi:diguanylate cyclase (GGDEF)-like protein
MRGPGAVSRFSRIEGVAINGLCDKYADRAERCQGYLERANMPKAKIYSGDEGYKQLCESDDIDLVYIATSWQLHVPVALYAMEHGKHVAIEVPSANKEFANFEDVDEIEKLGAKIRTIQSEMRVYLDYLKVQAYTDALTKVGSSTSYHELIHELNARIAKGAADFYALMIDVNSLKEINDNLGHEYGDMVIVGAAEAIAGVFGAQSTYRIGGDEFAVVKEAVTESEMAGVDRAISEFNAAETGVTLSLSKGAGRYRPGVDAAFKNVFARADQAMYKNKKEYYETIGNRRTRRPQEVK